MNRMETCGMTDEEKIGAKIAELRNGMNLTQDELATRAGITRTHLSRIEAGKYSSRYGIICNILRVLAHKIEVVKIAEQNTDV